MYDAFDDPYCYPGTTVLKNLRNLKKQSLLTRYETAITAQRFDEPLPSGRLSVGHYCAVHRHLFQDVYPWAGKYRTVRISKQGNMFCYPENISSQMKQLFGVLRANGYLRGLSADPFSRRAAEFLPGLNAIHPFRDGNGRAQLAFMALLADQARHTLRFDNLAPQRFLNAMVRSFQGDETPLAEQIRSLLA